MSNGLIVVLQEGGLLKSDGTLADGVLHALSTLRRGGFVLVSLSGVGQVPVFYSDEQLQQILDSQGVVFDHVIRLDKSAITTSISPEKVTAMAGHLAPVLAGAQYTAAESVVVGDESTAKQLAEHLSFGSFNPLLDTASRSGLEQLLWSDIANQLLNKPRTATVHRKSNETDIKISLNLDPETQQISINTGLGFFDHMLEQIGKHSGMSLLLECNGDLHIDEHHTVEDCGLALGQALRDALGNKRGVARYGFVLPMDECQVQVSMDLSARPSFHFIGEFSRDKVGDLSTEMVPHFFKSLSDTLGASLHITLDGDNAHHQIEVIFKGVARTLGQAIARHGLDLPSTKGML